jgi:hypothetical protein
VRRFVRGPSRHLWDSCNSNAAAGDVAGSCCCADAALGVTVIVIGFGVSVGVVVVSSSSSSSFVVVVVIASYSSSSFPLLSSFVAVNIPTMCLAARMSIFPTCLASSASWTRSVALRPACCALRDSAVVACRLGC